jgi:signal transduction histidine kinase
MIPPPMWQRWWFVTLAALAALGAGSAAYRVRVGRLLALERVRTAIATDLHDAVGADLSRISLLADVAQRDIDSQPARARSLVGEVAKTARDAVREMSDIVWALQSKPADLSQVLGRVRDYAAEAAASTGVALTVSAGEEPQGVVLDDEGRRELYLILKEAVSNVIRHAGARTLTVEVRAERRGLVAEVRDDGRGFTPEARARGLGGRGLGNMRARAARLKGTLTVESHDGGGTTVRLTLPSA